MADTRYALGVEIPTVSGLRAEIGMMERLSEAMYAAARELRACDKPIAASAVEWGALHLIGEADDLRPHIDTCGAMGDSPIGAESVGPCRLPVDHAVTSSSGHRDRNGNGWYSVAPDGTYF